MTHICKKCPKGIGKTRNSLELEEGGGGAEVNIWGEYGGIKMLSKNTGDGVHLIVKLSAISLEACKFTKNELHAFFQGF